MDYEPDLVFPRENTGRDAMVRNMYRQGKVVEILCDETRTNVRVQWLDKEEMISRPLPVKQFCSRSTSAFWCPKVGDDVNVTMLPNSDSDGFVDGSFYNTSNPPPTDDPNRRLVRFNDETLIEYVEATPESTTRAARAGVMTIKSKYPI